MLTHYCLLRDPFADFVAKMRQKYGTGIRRGIYLRTRRKLRERIHISTKDLVEAALKRFWNALKCGFLRKFGARDAPKVGNRIPVFGVTADHLTLGIANCPYRECDLDFRNDRTKEPTVNPDQGHRLQARVTMRAPSPTLMLQRFQVTRIARGLPLPAGCVLYPRKKPTSSTTPLTLRIFLPELSYGDVERNVK